jgi:hypothetical protein
MTAEIAILNSSGIALAADSAVTIGKQKVYNSANKLFALSKYQPIGIMVYDSADLMQIPWEIIIKEYRMELGEDCFSTLEEYAKHFWEFLRTNNKVIPDNNKEQYVDAIAYNYLDIIYTELERKSEEEIKTTQQTTFSKSLSILKSIIDDHQGIIVKTEFLPDFNEDDATAFVEGHNGLLDKVIDECLGELSNLLDNNYKSILKKSISYLFLKTKFTLRYTGVVIAGYGTNEMFPKIASYIVEGIVGDKIKKMFIEAKSNIQFDKFSTTIIPFAQDEMVWTFMSGIDPAINKFINSFLSDLFEKYPLSLHKAQLGIGEETINDLKELLINDGKKLLKGFEEELAEFKQQNSIQPIIGMVGVLPKDELAAMAESLVNLTVFKRKVSNTVETVGGPIDVAIISKGDGFIWVKRKHYFKPELNQHFFSNYFRKVNKND